MRSKKIIWLSLGFLIFFGLLFLRDWLKNQPLKNAIDELKNQVEKLEAENLELSQRLEDFDSPEAIEKKIKQNLNLAREGETVIIFKSSETSTLTAPEEQTIKKDFSYYTFKLRESLKSLLNTLKNEE